MSKDVIKRFLSYVEIMTKITSAFTFFMTLGYLYYLKQPIDIKKTLIFFVGMFLFDLTTTAINNYVDTKTNSQALQFPRKTAFVIILVMFGISAAFGLYLAYLTDIVVLLLGVLCFVCGVLYTYGPIPISRQPLGEIFSGVFYGLLIPGILIYINMPAGTYLDYSFSIKTISFSIHLKPLIHLLLLSAAPVLTTANIMLANNICDVEKDVKVKRFTLPYYIGNNAIWLFAALYYIIYAVALLMVLIGMVSPLFLLIFITIIPVQKNINKFRKEQKKDTTFLCSIQNFMLIMGASVILWFACGLIT